MSKKHDFLKKRLLQVISVLTVAFLACLYPAAIANAAQLTGRSLTLGSSAVSTSTTHKFDFVIPSTDSIGSIKFLYCTAASGTCTTPTGLTTTSATLDAQSGETGFTVVNTTNGSPYITRTASAGNNTVSFTLGSITNPSTTNQTFYVRVSTYASTDTTGSPVDSGTVAASTANQITVSASVDETLVFCTGTSGITSSSCAGATGTSVNLGTLTTSTTGSGTSQIGISTNGGSGYAVTVAGNTLTSGSNTIAALATQTASSQGTSQFGINLKDNATPNIGSEPAGAGTGTPTANYGTADQFRFVTGDAVASKASADDFRLYTVSYIANISGSQPAGSYSTTLTYVGTATY